MNHTYNDEERALIAAAEKVLSDARVKANESLKARQAAMDPKERMVFAANWRCVCGHGMAYDPAGILGYESTLRKPSAWECSAILLGIADKDIEHTGAHPFAFYEAKSENQPSANGQTTREPIDSAAMSGFKKLVES